MEVGSTQVCMEVVLHLWEMLWGTGQNFLPWNWEGHRQARKGDGGEGRAKRRFCISIWWRGGCQQLEKSSSKSLGSSDPDTEGLDGKIFLLSEKKATLLEEKVRISYPCQISVWKMPTDNVLDSLLPPSDWSSEQGPSRLGWLST